MRPRPRGQFTLRDTSYSPSLANSACKNRSRRTAVQDEFLESPRSLDLATLRLTAVAVRRHQENSRSGRIWWQCRPRRTEEAKAQLEASKAGSNGRESRARDDTRDEGDVRESYWGSGPCAPATLRWPTRPSTRRWSTPREAHKLRWPRSCVGSIPRKNSVYRTKPTKYKYFN